VIYRILCSLLKPSCHPLLHRDESEERSASISRRRHRSAKRGHRKAERIHQSRERSSSSKETAPAHPPAMMRKRHIRDRKIRWVKPDTLSPASGSTAAGRTQTDLDREYGVVTTREKVHTYSPLGFCLE